MGSATRPPLRAALHPAVETGPAGVRRRTALVLVLTVGAASTDALSYLGLGHVFPANMTGNTVLLAVDVTTSDYASAVRSLLALAGFVIGAVAAAGITEPDEDGDRPARTMHALLVEFLVLLVAAVWWLLTGTDRPENAAQLGVIALFGMAMGAQSAAMARLDVPVSTTYITGTWTQVSTWLAALLPGGSRRRPAAPGHSDHILQLAVLACYLAAALGAGYLFRFAGRAVAFVPCATTAAVCTIGLTRTTSQPHA
ncbi:MAG TPA: YoaK family protein [Jatrophihabitans sp.]|nr:YoaK family protein [Jatrophihabitans sp.]